MLNKKMTQLMLGLMLAGTLTGCNFNDIGDTIGAAAKGIVCTVLADNKECNAA